MAWKYSYAPALRQFRHGKKFFTLAGATQPGDPGRGPSEIQIDHRRREQRQHLADQQSTNDADAQRFSQLGAHAAAKGQRNGAQQRGHGGHHDRTEAQQARLVDGFLRPFPFLALRFQRKVDHHDGVLLHNADQKYDPDQRNDIQIFLEQNQGQQRAHPRRWQRGKNRDGVDKALIQHAQNQVHRDAGRQDQDQFVGQPRFKRAGRPLEAGFDAGRHAQVVGNLLDMVNRRAQRRSLRQVERKRDHRELALVVNRNGGRNRRCSYQRSERRRRQRRRSRQGAIGPRQRDGRRQIGRR